MAALGHGIAGVDSQIHDDLLDHAGISFNGENAIGATQLQSDVLAEKAMEHFDHVTEDRIQVQNLGLHHLLAAEHEELASEAGGALGSKRNLLQRFGNPFVPIALSQEAIGMALDDGQDVIEIMCDSGGELADGL